MIKNIAKIYFVIKIVTCSAFAGISDIDTTPLLQSFTRERFNVLAFDYCSQYAKFTSKQQDKDRISFYIKDAKSSLCSKKSLVAIQEFIDKQYEEKDVWQCVNMLQDSLYQQKIQHIVDSYLDCDKTHKKTQ